VASEVTVMVIGQVSSGKSSFVNSLLGRRLLPSSDRPTDGVISILQETAPGEAEKAELVYPDGRTEPFAGVEEGAQFLARQHTSVRAQLRAREVRFCLNDPILREVRLVNTPGLGDRLGAYQDVTLDYLHEDESDLIVWMFFPDSAANRGEIGLFSQALARRRHAVLGVVTRALEDHEDEPDYDPHADPGLLQVAEHLRTHLGTYLNDVIFYDAHNARKLVAKLRGNSELHDDPAFQRLLQRCGYTQLMQALRDAVGDDRVRTRSVWRRCAAEATELRKVAAAAEKVFEDKVRATKDQLAAFATVDSEQLMPVRHRIDAEIHKLADEAASELVAVFSQSATDVIAAQFTLGASLMDTIGGLVAKARGADQRAEALGTRLGHNIQDEVARRLAAARFEQRISAGAGSIIGRQLSDLASGLRMTTSSGYYQTAAGTALPIDIRQVGGASSILMDEIVARILSTLAETATKSAAQAGAAVAGGAAAGAASRSLATRALGIYTMVLVPLDIRKLYADFNQGKLKMAQTITTAFNADHALHAKRIRDTLTPAVDAAFEQLRAAARAAMTPADDTGHRWQGLWEAAQSTGSALSTLADDFTANAIGQPRA
jgi:septin family protein